MEITAQDRRFFRAFGFLVLRDAFPRAQVRALAAEFDALMAPLRARRGARQQRLTRLFMDDDSPKLRALALHDNTAGAAQALLGRPALCVQVAGACHAGDTQWHSDNLGLPYRGVKFLLYLDRLGAASGALRVMPGSHRQPARADRLLYHTASESFGVDGAQLPAHVLETRPGDLIAFAHPLWHASFHGRPGRRMVEVNFYADPRGPVEVEAFTAQMRMNHRAATAAGLSMYPAAWREAADPRQRRWVQRLAELKVLDAPRARAAAGRKADMQARPPKPAL